MKDYCSLIQDALDDKLTTTVPEKANSNTREYSSDEEDIFEKLRNMRNNSKTSEKDVGDEPGSQDVFDTLKENAPSNNRDATIGNQTTENSNMLAAEKEADVMQNGNTSFGNKKSRIRNVIESDSEEEEHPTEVVAVEEDEGETAKRSRRLSDSDSEKPTSKRSRIIDSDED